MESHSTAPVSGPSRRASTTTKGWKCAWRKGSRGVVNRDALFIKLQRQLRNMAGIPLVQSWRHNEVTATPRRARAAAVHRLQQKARAKQGKER